MAPRMHVLVVVLAPNKMSSPAKSSLSSKSHQEAFSETVGMFANSAIVGSMMPVTIADSEDAEDRRDNNQKHNHTSLTGNGNTTNTRHTARVQSVIKRVERGMLNIPRRRMLTCNLHQDKDRKNQEHFSGYTQDQSCRDSALNFSAEPRICIPPWAGGVCSNSHLKFTLRTQHRTTTNSCHPNAKSLLRPPASPFHSCCSLAITSIPTDINMTTRVCTDRNCAFTGIAGKNSCARVLFINGVPMYFLSL